MLAVAATPAPPPIPPPTGPLEFGHGADSPGADANCFQSGGHCALKRPPLRQQPLGSCRLVVSPCTGCVGNSSVVPASPGPCALAPGTTALTQPVNELFAGQLHWRPTAAAPVAQATGGRSADPMVCRPATPRRGHPRVFYTTLAEILTA